MNYFNFNRLDLVLKYLYFRKVFIEKSPDKDFYKNLYIKHILSRTGGNEPCNVYNKDDFKKKNIEEYLKCSEKLFLSMKKNGYDKDRPILVSEENCVKNGSHRLACSRALSLTPLVKNVKDKRIDWGFSDLARFANETEMNEIIYRWLELNIENVSIIVLYQPTLKYIDKIKEDLKNHGIETVFDVLKKFDDWSIVYDVYGNQDKCIERKIKKLKDNRLNHYKVCLVYGKEKCLAKTDLLKHKYRELYKNNFKTEDFICLHTPSNKSELKRLSNVLFSRGYNQFNKFYIKEIDESMFSTWLGDLDDLFKENSINKDETCIVGSSVMEAIGLRKSTDIDIIVNNRLRRKYKNGVTKLSDWCDIVCKNYSQTQLKDQTIINDGAYHFYYRGFKFATPKIVYHRKKKQAREKDLLDIKKFHDNFREKDLIGYE